MENSPVELRVCVDCGIPKPLESFYLVKPMQRRKKCFTCYNKQCRRYQNARKKIDPCFKLLNIFRSRITVAIKTGKKSTSTIELLGCPLSVAKSHIESQFKEGMSWENHGEWHIDHIKPCASYDLTLAEEQKKCFHYTNLQPLWAADNLAKSDKLPTQRTDNAVGLLEDENGLHGQ